MSAVSVMPRFQIESHTRSSHRFRALPALAALAAAVCLAVAVPWFGTEPGGGDLGSPSWALGLFSQARAAEANLFAGPQIVQIVNKITVTPIADPELAKIRWMPLVSLDASGKPRYEQLRLAAEPGKSSTLEDQSWYDPASRRYARVITSAGKTIFATAFDGKYVYDLESAEGRQPRVEKHPISKDFPPPRNPADFLGISAGLRSALENKDGNLIEAAGKTKLEDGAEAYLLKLVLPSGGPKDMDKACFLITIRADNHLIEKMEFAIDGQTMFVVRHEKSGSSDEPTVSWNLAGIGKAADATTSGIGIVAGMVVPDVSLAHMVEKADFPTYVFGHGPSWAGNRQIVDILDLVSPPHRMFITTYQAKAGRHVVLAQAYTYNKMLGPAAKSGKLVYTSPGGTKIWSGPRDQWLAQILLQSARAVVKDPPAKDATGYLLETPAGTYPALAINGHVTDDELHALIDDLLPAKKLLKD